eukprot:s1340_g28.t1
MGIDLTLESDCKMWQVEENPVKHRKVEVLSSGIERVFKQACRQVRRNLHDVLVGIRKVCLRRSQELHDVNLTVTRPLGVSEDWACFRATKHPLEKTSVFYGPVFAIVLLWMVQDFGSADPWTSKIRNLRKIGVFFCG